MGSLEKIKDELNILLNEKNVKYRNSNENQNIVLLQHQKRTLENKIKRIENGEPEEVKTEKILSVECEGNNCTLQTNDPSKLCAICKSKKDNKSKL